MSYNTRHCSHSSGGITTAPWRSTVKLTLPFATCTKLTTPLRLSFLALSSGVSYAFAGITAELLLFSDQFKDLGATFLSESWG